MQVEIWRNIPSQPNYEASTFGRIRRAVSRTSGKAGKVLQAVNRGNGYLCVSMLIRGKWRVEAVHRLIAETFLDRPDGADTINHKDANRGNNRPENLEWVTQADNVQHSYRTGRQKPEQNRGEANGQAKLTEADVRAILATTDRSRGYQARLSRQYGLSRSYVSEIFSGRVWKHLHEKETTLA